MDELFGGILLVCDSLRTQWRFSEESVFVLSLFLEAPSLAA